MLKWQIDSRIIEADDKLQLNVRNFTIDAEATYPLMIANVVEEWVGLLVTPLTCFVIRGKSEGEVEEKIVDYGLAIARGWEVSTIS